ncbi:VOC family protein [Rhodovibrionaceae bacterium A322]
MQRPKINQNVIFTYTDDLEAASRFFSEVLELDFVVDQGACHIFRMTDQSYIGVCNLPDRPSNAAAVTITLVSDDVDGWHRFLTDKGLEFVREPAHSEQFSVYSSLFLSPHGYRIEIQHFDDPDWHKKTLPPKH